MKQTKPKPEWLRDDRFSHPARPSWRKYGEGRVEVRVSRHTAATDWAGEISIEETAYLDDERLLSRYCSVTLTEPERRRVLAVLAPGYWELLEAARATTLAERDDWREPTRSLAAAAARAATAKAEETAR